MQLDLHIHFCCCLYIIDVDECLHESGGCAQICVNDFGSYHCECAPGYTLQSDGLNCAGKVYIMCIIIIGILAINHFVYCESTQ